MTSEPSQESMQHTVHAEMYFFHPGEKFSQEKPYGFKFPPKNSNIPRTNIEHHEHACEVADMRIVDEAFSIDRNGFTVFDLSDSLDLSYEDYHDDREVQRYFRLLESRLKDHVGAREAKVFRWGVSQPPRTR